MHSKIISQGYTPISPFSLYETLHIISLPLSTRRTNFSFKFWKRWDQKKKMPMRTLKVPVTNICRGGLLRFLRKRFLRNFIQDNIEIIFLNWFLIVVTKSFTGYKFLFCKHVWVFGKDFELDTILFSMN